MYTSQDKHVKYIHIYTSRYNVHQFNRGNIEFEEFGSEN